MISERTLEEIKHKADIVSIISAYVPLKKRGRNYLGLCPFHNEKTPSFTVSAEKSMWHCFGCGAGGNVLSFVMKIENLNFVEAAKSLAEKVGVTVEEDRTVPKARQEKKELLYAVCSRAGEFFQRQLQAPQGALAREYLQKRGVPEQMIAKFRLGYAPQEWDSLLKDMTQAGFSAELLEQAGLVLEREGSGGHYDRFRGRLIFTVGDNRGRAVGFGGRILADTNEPKYLNSPETEIFGKGRLLYAFYEAQPALRKAGTVILTEGYMDTLTCHQYGFENAVATLGTALTLDQARLLARYVQNVILAYDADQAGQAATERGIEILQEAGLEVKVAKLTGKDPDEMLRTAGKEEFALALSRAVPWVRYLLDRSFSHYELGTPEGKNSAAEAALKILSKVSAEVLRNEYIRYVSETLKVKAEVLLAAFRQKRYDKVSAKSALNIWSKPAPKHGKAQETLLKIALADKDLREKVLAGLTEAELTEEAYRKLYKEIVANREKAGYAWVEELAEEETRKLARRLLLEDEPWAERNVADCLAVLGKMRGQKQQELLREELKAAEERGDGVKARELLEVMKNNI